MQDSPPRQTLERSLAVLVRHEPCNALVPDCWEYLHGHDSLLRLCDVFLRKGYFFRMCHDTGLFYEELLAKITHCQ